MRITTVASASTCGYKDSLATTNEASARRAKYCTNEATTCNSTLGSYKNLNESVSFTLSKSQVNLTRPLSENNSFKPRMPLHPIDGFKVYDHFWIFVLSHMVFWYPENQIENWITVKTLCINHVKIM